MKEKTFSKLTDAQQKSAMAMFSNAADGDGYWYLITEDCSILSRNKQKGGRPVKPHRSGGGHWVGG